MWRRAAPLISSQAADSKTWSDLQLRRWLWLHNRAHGNMISAIRGHRALRFSSEMLFGFSLFLTRRDGAWLVSYENLGIYIN